MKLSKEIVGKNKIRDLMICLLYIAGKMPSEILIERNLPLTKRRVEQIIYKNAGFVNPRIAWPKSKRIHLRQWLIDKRIQGVTNFSDKDVIDQLNFLRDEIEGGKPIIDQSQHTHITLTTLAEQYGDESDSSSSIDVRAD